MGYMALLRNLGNFDQAEVSDEVAAGVASKLADPEQVRRSRQFPYRFVSAYRAAPSLRWGHALEKALEVATSNIPALAGRTLVLVEVDRFTDRVGEVGHGTRMAEALRATYRGHDRVVIFSDMQVFPDSGTPRWASYSGVATEQVPAHVPVYGFNLAGYATSPMKPAVATGTSSAG